MEWPQALQREAVHAQQNLVQKEKLNLCLPFSDKERIILQIKKRTACIMRVFIVKISNLFSEKNKDPEVPKVYASQNSYKVKILLKHTKD